MVCIQTLINYSLKRWVFYQQNICGLILYPVPCEIMTSMQTLLSYDECLQKYMSTNMAEYEATLNIILYLSYCAICLNESASVMVIALDVRQLD